MQMMTNEALRVTVRLDEKAKHSAVEESIKTIRANFLFCSSNCKTVLLTSNHAHEGKTTISMQLACSLTEIGKRVLLIDADLRKGTLIRHCDVALPSVKGLSQYLSGQAELSEVICRSQFDNLDVIFAGQVPPNPAELCGSLKFKELLDGAKEAYDYILVDTPPVGMVIDAAMLAPYCDGALMVLSIGEVRLKNALDVKGQIEKAGCPFIGAIMNEARQNKKAGFALKKKTQYYSRQKYGE
ncbi:MAG: CpsD/CapB family tyrosine-protein kinase [Clostridia bacterium]|nr:CpsD/CapB family tyrosine-protein kinase [Clostridia bacterium]